MSPAGRLRVAVLGARGRMGTAACAAISAQDDLSLVAALGHEDPLDDLVAARPDVAVDLTRPDAVAAHVELCVARGIHVVVGTSGFTDTERYRTARTGVLVVPNFALGAVLMMRFAAEAAPWFESVEIIELHHPDKADAPSGTARRTAELVADARRGAPSPPDATADPASAARGLAVEGVRVHSVRLRGLVAHQEVLLGGQGETLTIRHDSFDRSSFMPGLLLAVRAVPSHPGLTVGLEHVLGTTRP